MNIIKKIFNKCVIMNVKLFHKVDGLKKCFICLPLKINRFKSRIYVDEGTIISKNVKFYSFGGDSNNSELKIGKKVYINENVLFNYASFISIGDGCLIGPNVSFFDFDHDVKNRKIINSKPIIIGKNVWIGAGSIILKGVKIGDNTIIGAGSIVTKSFGDNLVIAGNPAKIIKNI